MAFGPRPRLVPCFCCEGVLKGRGTGLLMQPATSFHVNPLNVHNLSIPLHVFQKAATEEEIPNFQKISHLFWCPGPMDPKKVKAGQPLQVGQHRVTPTRQLGFGAYSTVFCCKDMHEHLLALKRTVVPDAEARERAELELEVLRSYPHPNLIAFVDCSVTRLRGDAAEVYLLMEYAQGSLLSAMQTLQQREQRFSETQILTIFTDVVAAVVHLHAQDPPIAHRDLKVENVVCARDGEALLYKLCDLGSCLRFAYEPTTQKERQWAEDEIEAHTTLEYRCAAARAVSAASTAWAWGAGPPVVDAWWCGLP